jgi:glycosyltransferase involved in cell wall biosynthesis
LYQYIAWKSTRKCVDSIIGQTYENIEIILIDDGSPDNCPAICDGYEEMDDRIRVIHKDNRDARNVGIKESRGEYIAFIDGDDYVAANFVEVLVDQAVVHDADISVCSYYRAYGTNMVREAKRVDTATLTTTSKRFEMYSYTRACVNGSAVTSYTEERYSPKTILIFQSGKPTKFHMSPIRCFII